MSSQSAGGLKLSFRRPEMLRAYGAVFEPGEMWSNSRWEWRVQVSLTSAFLSIFRLPKPSNDAQRIWKCLIVESGMTQIFGWHVEGFKGGALHTSAAISGRQMVREERQKWVDIDEDRGHSVCVSATTLSPLQPNSCSPKSCFSFLSRSDSWGCQKLGDYCSLLRLILCD